MPNQLGGEPALDISAGPSSDLSASSRQDGRKKRSVPTSFIVSCIVAVAAIVAALLFFGPDDEAASAADSEPVPAVDPVEDTDDDNAGGVGEAAGVGTTDPLASDRLVSDSVAQLFRNEVGDWAVIYPSPMGLQILSEAGTVQPAVTTATGFEEAAQFPLISDGRRSWAVDPQGLTQAYLVSTQFVVIDIDQDGRVAFINDQRDPRNIGESSFGAWGPGFDVPLDADILPVRQRGLFVLPRTGGTYKYESNGVVPVSDDVLIAASIDSEVFERCDAELACELYLTTPTQPEPRVIDFQARDTIWISPGGTWMVVRTLGGESMLLSTETDERLDLVGSVRAVDWSDDASIAAVLTDEALTMVFPERQETQSVTLPIAPSASSVLLVSTA